MIVVDVTSDAAAVARELRADLREQVPYALSRAINTTMLEAQAAQRAAQHDRFITRRRQWMDRSVKLKPFASKRQLTATLSIDPPGGRADILTKFEDGGTKRAQSGRLAVPDAARTTPRQVVPRSRRPKAFGFRLHGTGPHATVFTGAKRTFMVQRPDGTGGIYQRTGARKGKRRRSASRLASDIATRKVRDLAVRTLYRFTPQATIDSRLRFEDTVVGVISARFARNLDEALERAIASGRGRVAGRLDGRDVIVATPEARRIARSDVYR